MQTVMNGDEKAEREHFMREAIEMVSCFQKSPFVFLAANLLTGRAGAGQ